MNLKSLIFGSPASLYDLETKQEVTLKVVTSESFSASAEPSSYPIEVSSDFTGDVSDHVKPAPDSFQIEAVLVDPHLLQLTDRKSIEAKIETLKYWMSSGILLGYSSPAMSSLTRSVYQYSEDNLILSSIDWSRSADNGTAVIISLSLRHVTVVQSETAEIKLPQAAKPVAQKGTGETETAEVDEKKGFWSFLKDSLKASGEAASSGDMIGGWY